MSLRIVWINKSDWRKPGPIVYMGLLNALAFAEHGLETDYFVGHGEDSNTEEDLQMFYGVKASPFLHIQRIKQTASGKRDVYSEALNKINDYLKHGDHVIALTRELGALAKLLKAKNKQPSLKVIYESHDYFLTRTHLAKQGFSALRRQWAERFLIPRADGLVCLTEHQRALYQQHLPKLPMLAASLGCVSFPTQDMERRRFKRNVVYIGHLHPYKGSDLIFELAKSLKSKNITLSCYGGHERQVRELRSKAEQLELSAVLNFESFVSPAELHRVLDHEVSIGLVPLQDTFYSRYLTCPVKGLDFLSHGLPIVASDLPSTHEILRRAGRYCRSSVASEFAEVIEGLLDESSAYQQASKDSYFRREQLQWYGRAEKILSLVN